MPSQRYPAVAGAFYPQDRFRLQETAEKLVRCDRPASAARAVMLPHAGYVYSGGCAGFTLAQVEIPSSVILLGPNHTGRGAALSAAEEQSWSTPLGSLPVDRELLDALAEGCPELKFDSRAHSAEHSLEVQLPLLQVLKDACAIAPITVGTHDPALLESLGRAIAAVIENRDDVLIVISSDMTHYESAESAREKDMAAIKRLEAVDAAGLLETVGKQAISMCGVAPAAAALHALQLVGVQCGELTRYTHSGEVTGDTSQVVGYAGMVFRA